MSDFEKEKFTLNAPEIKPLEVEPLEIKPKFKLTMPANKLLITEEMPPLTGKQKKEQTSQNPLADKTFHLPGNVNVNGRVVQKPQGETAQDGEGSNEVKQGFEAVIRHDNNAGRLNYSAGGGTEIYPDGSKPIKKADAALGYNGENYSANLSLFRSNEGEYQHTLNTSLTGGNVTTNLEVSESNSEKSATAGSTFKFGHKKPLINPDNINSQNDNTQQRLAELGQTGSTLSVSTTVGKSKSTGESYHKESVVFKVDEKNYGRVDFKGSQSENNLTITAGIGNLTTTYTNTNNSGEENNINSNTLNTEYSTGKVNFGGNVSYTENKPVKQMIGAETPNTYSSTIGLTGQFNRNEWGEFNDNFNGAFDAGLNVENSHVIGYNLKGDFAFNKYGVGEYSADYLARLEAGIKKEGDKKTIDVRTMGCYRINDCNTIFENGLRYNSVKAGNDNTQKVSMSFGIYQQVGKNFGDSSVYFNGQTGKVWETANTVKSSKWFVDIGAGADIKVGERTYLTSNAGYDTKNKWNGSFGVRVNLP